MKRLTLAASLILGMGVIPAIAGWMSSASEDWKNRTFTAADLKKYTGKGGTPAYVAVDGIVYDVSKARKWKNGTHVKMHEAGSDLSEALRTYTHEKGNILENIPKVGVLLAEAVKTAGKAAGAKNPGPASVTPHKIGKQELGKPAVCPVTGEKFKVAADTPAAEYKGKIYYFCCPSCYGPFKGNPEKYLNITTATK